MKPKKKIKRIQDEVNYLKWRTDKNDQDISGLYKLLEHLDERLKSFKKEIEVKEWKR